MGGNLTQPFSKKSAKVGRRVWIWGRECCGLRVTSFYNPQLTIRYPFHSKSNIYQHMQFSFVSLFIALFCALPGAFAQEYSKEESLGKTFKKKINKHTVMRSELAPSLKWYRNVSVRCLRSSILACD